MNQSSRKFKNLAALILATMMAISALYFAGIGNSRVQADTNAQPIPFSQNWTNINLITVNDDWSSVPGIIGYRGDDLTTAIGTDPRTILADGSAVIDVIANQTNPDTNATGGVAEFEITNPVVALQGSGTADAPHIVVRVNATGRSNIVFAANIRDIDGSADDAVQQVDVQYRVGGSGNYTSVAGGYIADATTAGTATQVTPLNLTLPAAADNQAIVDIRIITTNAPGSDEWVGVDDINVTGTGGPTPTPPARGTLYDFTGDGRTDWTTFRFGATTGAPIRWRVVGNPASPVPNAAFIREFDYGLTGDRIVPADYVGDRKTDMTVWRSGIYYVAQFPTGTGGITLDRAVQWGQSLDLAGSEGDYDGDGKIDYTVQRADFVSNTLTWFIMSSSTNTMRAVRFGAAANGFLPVTFPGADFTGDGRDELIIANGVGALGGPITYVIGDAVTGAGIATIPWGDAATDYAIPPADYTGDGRADLVAWRGRTGTAADAGVWYIRNTATGAATGTRFGIAAATGTEGDLAVRGDYDGDGKHDIGVYRRSNQTFYVLSSSNGSLLFQQSGAVGDFPLAGRFIY